MTASYTAPARVLIADDDLDLLNLVGYAFRNAGLETVGVTNGADALAAMDGARFSLVVLDMELPAPRGLDLYLAARKNSNVPVIVLGMSDHEDDLLQALNAGADAYLAKPFSPRVLIARARALLRRAADDEPRAAAPSRLQLDANEQLLIHASGTVALTLLEVRVLRLLMLNAGKTLTANNLIDEAWGKNPVANRKTVKQLVFRLRQKLLTIPEACNALKTVAGGYAWTEDPEKAAAALPLTRTVT